MLNSISSDFSPLPGNDHPILFIHSWHFNAGCWAGWIKYYRSKGYVCYAPSWPRYDQTPGTPERTHALTLDEIIEMYIFFIEDKFPKAPILVGHGAGALIALILASRGYALKCVLLGMQQIVSGYFARFRWQTTRNWVRLRDSCVIPSFSSFRQTFANQSSSLAIKSLYLKLMVPEHVQTIYNIRRDFFFYAGEVDCPLFFVSGEQDKVALSEKTQKYFLRYHAHLTGNLHRVLAGFDHVQLLEERFLNDMGILIEVWLSLSMLENERWLSSLTPN